MYHALKAGLTLVVIILVLKAFLPEVAQGLIDIITKMIDIVNVSIDQAAFAPPQ